MPILYLDHTAKMGGGEVALLNLASALDRARFKPVVVLGSDGPLVSKLRTAGVEAHVMPLDTSVVDTRKDNLGWRSLLKARQIAHCLGYAVRLARWARHRGVAIIHTNSLKADLYGGLAG
ncbi:MAG: glycosyltransferase, partial [Armatimonadetes bacterium]|nr:glycosyltransferase [Armatimonadota bacterium]